MHANVPWTDAEGAPDWADADALAVPASADRQFRLADGRRVTYREYGSHRGYPVLALHGTPGSRLKYAAADAEAHRLGLRLISPDRWGYGRTDAHDDPALGAYANDATGLVDALGIDRFSVVGISGGGPYAAAVAARLGRRVGALALVAPVGPISGAVDAGDLRLFHRLCFNLMAPLPGLMRITFELYRASLALAPKTTIRLVSVGAGPVDKALVRSPDVRDKLGETFRAGLERGASGPVIDLKLFSQPWQVRLEEVTARARIWLGTEDTNVPQAAVRALHRMIPGAELQHIGGQGHFWVSRHYGEVLGWLAQSR